MFRIGVILLATFSLIAVTDQSARSQYLPGVQMARGLNQTCDVTLSPSWCSEFWVPAGPAMDTSQGVIYQDAGGEFTALNSSPQFNRIDFMDLGVLPSDEGILTTSSAFRMTGLIETNFYSIEFNMNQNFWGCPFSFGASSCGVQMRLGLSHMIDRAKFAVSAGSGCAGTNNVLCQPIDNPELLGSGLLTPNPWGWDSMFSETGSNCIVGGPGGKAYHQAAATGANGYSWLPGPGSPDMNAAAAHFVAAG